MNMLPDGGTALQERKMFLPRMITFTKESVGPVGVWDDSSLVVSLEIFECLFSFVVHKERFMEAMLNDNMMVTIKWTRIMDQEQSATTGEFFYPLHAVVL